MGSKVSDFRKRKFGHFFDFIDLDKDGFLTEHDHIQSVTNLKKELNLGPKGENSIRRMTLGWWAVLHEEAGKSGGRVDKTCFIKRFAEYHESEDLTEPVKDHFKAMFRFIDQNDDKSVSFNEFLAYYRAHNSRDEGRIREIFKQLDINQDGRLSEEEFVHAHSTFWLSDDPENGYEFVYITQ